MKVFVHIPKTGGKAVATNFRTVKSSVKKHGIHLKASDYTKIGIDGDGFAIIRDPADRLLSLFTSHFQNSFDRFLDSMEAPDIEQRKRFSFSRPRGVMVPGTVLANQWDYIKDSPFKITLFKFNDWASITDFIGEKPKRNLSLHKPKEKDLTLLTPQRIKRIKEICSLDYKHLKPYIENDQ